MVPSTKPRVAMKERGHAPISVEFEASTLRRIDEVAALEYDGSREEAIAGLLERWLERRDG